MCPNRAVVRCCRGDAASRTSSATSRASLQSEMAAPATGLCGAWVALVVIEVIAACCGYNSR
jgi:hypothetical protein